jgi:hypothetical protein
MNVQRVYWVTVSWFGLMAMANGALDLQGDTTLGGVVTVCAGLVILAAGAWGALHPDDAGLPSEPGLLLYVGMIAAGLYTVVTVFRFI